MRRSRIYFVLLLMFLLSACQRSSVLERQSILLAIGYDAKENRTFEVTASLLVAQPDIKETSRTVSVEADTSKGARRQINQMLPYEIGVGQTRVILLDKDIFRLEMLNEIDVISRDPIYGDMMKVAIVDGSPGDLLKHPYKNYSNVGASLNNLLEHNSKMNWIPTMNLHDFTRYRGIKRIDLAIPLIKREGEEVVLTSLALIHGDQIVGEATPNEGFFLKTLKGEKTPYLYEIQINKDEMKASGMDQYLKDIKDEVRVVFNVTKNKGKIKLIDRKNIKFDVNIDMDVDIHEVSERYRFNENGAIAALEHQLNIELSNQFQQFLDKLRKLNSDCVGFGEVYRSRVGNSPQVEQTWSKEFPNTTLNGHVKINVIRTGIIE